MAKKNKLLEAPPYSVEEAIKLLGVNLRTARLRRNLTIQEIAEKIGVGTRAVMDAEKGKITTSVGIYVALLWSMDLLDQMYLLADPTKDEEGQILALSRERARARHSGDLNSDDF